MDNEEQSKLYLEYRNLLMSLRRGPMKQKQLLFIILFFSAFLSNANNHLPVSIDKLLPVKKIPASTITLKPNSTDIVLNTKPTKQTFQFPAVDEFINDNLKEQQNLLLDNHTTIDGNDNLGDVFSKIDVYKVHEGVVKAREAIAIASEFGTLIQMLESGEHEKLTMPITLFRQEIGNITYTTVIKSLKLKPQWAELELYMGIEIPDKDLVLYFGSPNVKFSSEAGIIGETILGLYSEVPIPIGGEKSAIVLQPYSVNPNVNATENPDDTNLHRGTYVKVDCDGFKEMGLGADIIFSKDWILPTDASGNPIPNKRVVGNFQTIASDLNDIFVTVNLPNFALAKKPDVQFTLQNAVFDYSDYQHDESVVFPEEYVEQELLPENIYLWRGIYIQNIEVTIPKVFKKKGCVADSGGQQQQQQSPGGGTPGGSGSIDLPKQDDSRWAWNDETNGVGHGPSAPIVVPKFVNENETISAVNPSCRISFGAEHLLIDSKGVSGKFYATPVLDINEGAMDKWSFSIDTIQIDVVINEITGFGFSGEIGIPISKKTQNFTYGAFIDDSDNYSFSLGIADAMDFPLWKAGEVVIEGGSKIIVDVVNNKFYPSAILTGSLSIGIKHSEDENNTNAKKLVEAPAIEFKKLLLKTTGPYIGILEEGYFRLNQDIGFAGFPVSINDIALVNLPGNQAGLNFEINIHMMNAQDHGFSASGEFTVIGKLSTEDGVQSWKYDKFQFEGAELFIILPTVKGYGFIKLFRGDEEFGNGFQAGIMLEIMDGKFGVESNAIFGKTLTGGDDGNGYRYWYVDGMVTFSPGIAVVGPLAINGFGGGLYHHMKMTAYDPYATGPGVTTSGMVYKPNEGTNFGLKASVSFITINPAQAASAKESGTLKGMATLQLEFGGGGLQNISLLATAQFLQGGDGGGDSGSAITAKLNERKQKLSQTKEETKTSDKNDMKGPTMDIRASVHIVLDFENDFELNGMLAVYAKLAQGKVYGVGSHNLVGAAHFLVKSGDWHIYIGGYMDNSLTVEGFNGEPFTISPVGIMFKDGPLHASVRAYFMVGNDIPGPGNVPNDVLNRFNVNPSDLYDNSGTAGRLARGSGFAFGAAFDFGYNYDNNKSGCCCKRAYANINGGIGFNIALLKYRAGAYCSQNGQSPVGMKGWRASGNVWGDIHAKGKKWCIGFNRGIGILLVGDVPNPARFFCKINILGFKPSFNIGQACTVLAGDGDF